MEWPKRARTADWENGVLALDREKQFEVPKLTAEIMERLAGYTLVGFHVKGYPVTDELLAPFAGHKSMVNFGVENGALTDACFPFFSAMPKLRYLLLTGNAGITEAACPPCKAVSWIYWPLTTPGWRMPVCFEQPPSPNSPTSGSTTLLLLMMDYWLSPATTTSIRWPMCNLPRSRWNTSPSSSGKRPKSPSSWMSRQRRNAAMCCPLSLPK